MARENIRDSLKGLWTAGDVQSFISNGPLAIALLDEKFRFVSASHLLIEQFNLRGEGALGVCLFEGVPSTLIFREQLASCLEGATCVAEPLLVRTTAGIERWIECEMSPWKNDAGQICGVLLANRDVTAQKNAESEVLRAKQFFNDIVERLPTLLAVKNAEGRFILLNRAGADLIGVDASDVVGKTDHEIFPRAHADKFVARDAAILQAGTLEIINDEIVPTSAGDRVLRCKKIAIYDSDGAPCLLTIGEDVTAEVEANRALQQALGDAEAANHAKTEFLAIMSHEIRTPLNGVLGMAQAMAGDDLSAVQAERLDVVRQSGEMLLAILNDILDLSKIESGKLLLEIVEFDPRALVKAADAAFSVLADKKGICLSFTIDNTAEGAFAGDSGRLRQILYNLVSNAIKFTENGAVRVAITRFGELFRMSVADSGIGIPADRIGALFQKFVQADASTARCYGGSGLGLSICRELAELMGGRITVESTVGKGSVFTFEAPLAKLESSTSAKSAEIAPAAALDLSGFKVLAAEDNVVNQMVLKTLLGQLGLDPVVVSNGQEAVEAWSNDRWDLILMDMQMPVLDGVGASALIRRGEAEGSRARTPILALTANVMSHQIETYLAAGMDGFIAKPIQVAQLFETIQSALAESHASEEDEVAIRNAV